MDHVARVSARIQHIPAVACADWGDRGAETLVSLPGVLGAAVVIGRGARVGEAITIDAVCVCAGRARPGAGSLSESEALAARARLESMAMSRGITLGEAPGSTDRIWGDHDCATLGSWARVGQGERVLMTLLAVEPGGMSALERLGVALDTITPLLGERARLALGESGGEPNWLTAREQLVLEQLILGKSVREIAEMIQRSPHTVHDHVKNLHRKLGATSRGALIARALGRLGEVRRHAGSEVEPKPGGVFADRPAV